MAKKTNLKDIWNQVPVDYYQKSNFFQKVWHFGKIEITKRLIKGQLAKKRKIRFLDVGCASGWYLSRMKDFFPQISFSGVDVYERAIAYGSKQYKDISFTVGNAEGLPYKSKSFDVITCLDVIEHVEDPKVAVKEMARVLSQNGAVIMGICTENILFKIVWLFWIKFRGKIWRGAHLHNFKMRDLEELFLDAGFKIREKKIYNLSTAVIYLLEK